MTLTRVYCCYCVKFRISVQMQLIYSELSELTERLFSEILKCPQKP
jgi:hypothetical protein